MKLQIGDGTPHVVISTQGAFTRISFQRRVSVRLLAIDPLRDIFYLGGQDTENQNPRLKEQVTFFTIPGDLYGIELCATNLRVELDAVIRPLIHFTVDNFGMHNSVVIKNNEFASLRLADSVGSTTFDLCQQPGLALHTRMCYNTILLLARSGGPTCLACAEQEATEVYLSCGHWGVCRGCSMRNECMRCPICRGDSHQMISLYVA